MKSRFVVMMFSLVAVAFLGCAPKAEEAEVQEGVQPAEVGRAFTDADFIEYKAQTAALSAIYEKKSLKLGEELGKLHEKYAGIEEKYGEWVANWQQRAIAEPETAGKQWTEMMKQVEKRTCGLICKVDKSKCIVCKK